MIAFPRRLARQFHAASAKCVVGRPRGPAPCVVLRQTKGRVTLTAAFPDVILELASPAPSARGRDEVLVVPMTALESVQAATDDPVEIEGTGTRGTARWHERGAARSVPPFVLPGKQHDPLPRATEMRSVPARLLAALHEAGRTASREDGRYALSRIQVKGRSGQVIATDGTVAVLFSGFSFPFSDEVLVPAVPLFGCPELREETDVRLGRTPSHLVVSAGGWTVWLAVVPAAKFPDVTAVVPRHAPTTVTLDRGDAATLLAALPGLPGQGHEHRPVTLDASGVLTVRGRDEDASTVREVTLPHSSVTGPAGQVTLDRRVLGKALVLSCRTLRLTPNKPLVATGDGVTVLAAPLDPDLAAPAAPTASVETVNRMSVPHPAAAPQPIMSSCPGNPEHQRRAIAMRPHEPNGRPPGNGRPEPNPPADSPDPLAAAEELRQALGEAMAKAGRLVTALKAGKKEKKALANVYAGLKQLNFGSNGHPPRT